jgi:hypothetical protein
MPKIASSRFTTHPMILLHFEFFIQQQRFPRLQHVAGESFLTDCRGCGTGSYLSVRNSSIGCTKVACLKSAETRSPSWLGVPLRTHSQTVGVLVVQPYEDERAYNERDLELLASVGSQIALGDRAQAR